ncbi:hypothetical protein LCGC14_0698540 [marine sediment metagenome]|uniref:Uncharacterized protein n=1 Tax=marine sediment metagenome TaxID=412755 RepID=A0A0F9QIJ1_9ZZZZ
MNVTREEHDWGGTITIPEHLYEEIVEALKCGCRAPAFIQGSGGCDLREPDGMACCHACSILVHLGELSPYSCTCDHDPDCPPDPGEHCLVCGGVTP